MIRSPTDSRHRAIEAILLAPCTRPDIQTRWYVSHVVDELCMWADLLSKSEGGGKLPTSFRQATVATTQKEIREFREQTAELAEKIMKGGRETRARGQLVKLIESLHAPAIGALGDVPPNNRRGIPDTYDLQSRLPARLRRRFPDDKGKTVLRPGEAEKIRTNKNKGLLDRLTAAGFTPEEIASNFPALEYPY
jgi:hypothetical protein